MSELLVTRDGAVMTITLNRPDVLNALNHALQVALARALGDAGAPEVRAVVLTGAGRGFCAGADMERLDVIAGGNQNWEKLPPPKAIGDPFVPIKHEGVIYIRPPVS